MRNYSLSYIIILYKIYYKYIIIQPNIPEKILHGSGITTGLMTHLKIHGLKSCKLFPPLAQISIKAFPPRRVAQATLWGFFSLFNLCKHLYKEIQLPGYG